MYVDVFYTYSVSSSSGESPKVFLLCLESGYGSKGTCVFLAAIPPNYRLISTRKVIQDIFVIIQVYPNTKHEGLVFYGDVHTRAR